MRILQVNDLLPGPGAGGAEVHLARLVEGLRGAGDEVEVFAGEVRHEGVAKVLDAWDPFARRALAARVAAFRPDVIHFHHVARELSVAVLGVGRGTPKVLTVHDFRLVGASDRTGRPVLDRLQQAKSVLDRRVVRRHVDAVIAVSGALAAALRSAGFPRVEHLRNFADPPAEGPPPPPPSACDDLVFAGRLAADKGAAQLVEAYRTEVAGRWPATALRVAGAGPEEDALRRLAAAPGPGRVELLGRLAPEAVAALFASARLVAIPSLSSLRPEGLPLVAVEAALAGRPLVVGDDPGLREFVDDCGCGLVADATDPAAFGAAMASLLDDPARADALGAAGRAAALDRYTTEAGVEAVRAVDAGLVAARSPS
jgi:glycosyltransferase involved in cell wall biosynthesis